jgi:uracil-DNA glycosylase
VRVVVLLGRIGWEAWLKASGWWERLSVRERPPFGHATEAYLPDGTLVICSFHPSRQNTNTGRLTRAMWHDIFRRARQAVDENEGSSRRRRGSVARLTRRDCS